MNEEQRKNEIKGRMPESVVLANLPDKEFDEVAEFLLSLLAQSEERVVLADGLLKKLFYNNDGAHHDTFVYLKSHNLI